MELWVPVGTGLILKGMILVISVMMNVVGMIIAMMLVMQMSALVILIWMMMAPLNVYKAARGLRI